MVRSIDPRRVTLRQFQWPSQAAALLGTHTAETILASGHVRPHRKAGHMEASDPIKFSVQPLQEGAVHIWNRDKGQGLKTLVPPVPLSRLCPDYRPASVPLHHQSW